MSAEDIEIATYDGELVQLTMTVHDAEDIAWAIQYHSRHSSPSRAWTNFAKRLQEYAESRDEYPRVGFQIVMVPR